jgi:3-keto-disaccharide hydrolase
MKTSCIVFAAIATFAVPAWSQDAKAFVGRWDLTLTSPRGGTWPQWMEVEQKGDALSGRIQPRGGAVRPIVAAKVEGGHLLINVQAAGRGPAVDWDLTVEGGKLSGVQKQGDNTDTKIAGVRAPELKRPMPKSWTAPEALFNGKDLTGWEPIGNPVNNHWAAKDGELVNEAKGSNLRTTKTFQDFKLHVEVNCPNTLPDGKTQLCNSGIYLRGRDEVQVGSEGGTVPTHEMGSLYGFIAPAVDMPLGAGEWQTFDITLVGRTLTVVRNGTKIHDNVEIPGITGGALDSNEAEPGPIFFQGDHDPGMRYRNLTIALPKN